MPLTFGSLFAGIGGLDLGLERAGMECRWQVEIDEYARRVLAKHWPNVRRHDDVKTWPQSDTEGVEVICGGFPCQDISNAGKRAGIGGERSGLWVEYLRIICELRPRYVLVENVAALLSPRRIDGRVVESAAVGRVLGDLAAVGFDAEWHCIPAAAVGAPHIRDRVFILGFANGDRRQARKSAEQAVGYGSASESASGHASSMANAASDGRKPRRTSHGTESTQRREPNRSRLGGVLSDAIGEHDDDGRHGAGAILWREREASRLCEGEFWFVEPAVGRVADGVPHRVDRLRGLGNAVVPQVAEWIGRRIVESQCI